MAAVFIAVCMSRYFGLGKIRSSIDDVFNDRNEQAHVEGWRTVRYPPAVAGTASAATIEVGTRMIGAIAVLSMTCLYTKVGT
jgi:hypothetical protein